MYTVEEMNNIDQQTLVKAAQGDMEAFEQVYRAYSPFVYNVARRMVEAKEDAEDLTQEVFLIIHSKLNSFMFRSSLKTWVYRITANCAINFLNKRNRESKGRVDFETALALVPGPQDPREGILEEDRKYEVDRLLNLLNPDERACVVLRNMQKLSYVQIAESLNVNINTVRTRLKRSREKMLKSQQEVNANEL